MGDNNLSAILKYAAGLSVTEDQLLVELLGRLGSRMSYEVFRAVAAKFVLIAVEVVVLRVRAEEMQVFLTQRPADDPDWPRHWHIPGTIIRNSDTIGNPIGAEDPLQRLVQEELRTSLTHHQLLEVVPVTVTRGKAVAFIYVGTINDDPPHGGFFNVNKLPAPFVQSQYDFLLRAVRFFHGQGW